MATVAAAVRDAIRRGVIDGAPADWHLLDGAGADKMTWLERKLQTLESEMHAARTAGELKVAIKYYMQVKAAVARERAAAAAGDRAPNRFSSRARRPAFENPTA